MPELPDGARRFDPADEPATHATEAERCVCCQGDARPEWGGNGKHCQLCIGRGHDEDEETHDA